MIGAPDASWGISAGETYEETYMVHATCATSLLGMAEVVADVKN